jgi:hypothetical protein
MFLTTNGKLVLSSFYAILFWIINNPIFAQQNVVPISPDIDAIFSQVASDAEVQEALQLIQQAEPETVREQFRITEIPAPSL